MSLHVFHGELKSNITTFKTQFFILYKLNFSTKQIPLPLNKMLFINTFVGLLARACVETYVSDCYLRHGDGYTILLKSIVFLEGFALNRSVGFSKKEGT